jgi:hypothetical protein
MGDLANNTVLAVLARLAMLGATAALPVAGWLLLRGIDSIDRVSTKVDVIHDQITETASNVKLLQQSQTAQQQLLADHEARVRSLERMQKGMP